MATATSKPVEFKPWNKPSVEGSPPSARQGHACAVVGDKTYLFGGSCVIDETTVYLADLFCLSNNNSNDLNWTKIEPQGELPSAREGHAFIAIGTNIYLLGGTNSDNSSNSIYGTWSLDTEAHVWKRPETTGLAPEAFSYSAVVTGDGQIVTFGGVLNGKAGNSTHILDTSSMEWLCPDTKGQVPQARCDHGSAVVGRRVAVFGGSAGEDLWLNDLHFLDLDTMVWTLVCDLGVPPPPRDYPVMVSVCDRVLVVSGGYSAMDDGEKCFNDTFYIDTAQNSIQWQQANTDGSDLPNGRYSHSVSVCNNKLILFGGMDTEQTFDDLWIREVYVPSANFSPTIPPRRKYKTATPIPAPRKTLAAPTPQEVEPRNFDKMRAVFVAQVNELFDTITNKFQELDRLEAKLTADREQLDEERKELHETYDKQQQELQELKETHIKDNEEWIRQHLEENDAERERLAADKARIEAERAELNKEKAAFTEKSTKLDAIMRQVQGLATP